MSIDYEQLQARLAKAEDTSAHRLDRAAANVVLEATAKDTARELLRQRDGIERVLAQMNDHAALLRGWEQHNLAYHVEQYARLLADELKGDTE